MNTEQVGRVGEQTAAEAADHRNWGILELAPETLRSPKFSEVPEFFDIVSIAQRG